MADRMLSSRADHIHSITYLPWMDQVFADTYHPITNPGGLIDMTVSENQLVEDKLLEKLRDPECNKVEPYMLYYCPSTGLPTFKKALAEFVRERFQSKLPITEDNVVVVSGAGPAAEQLTHVIADAGDTFLCGTPCYYGTQPDIGYRNQCKLEPVYLSAEDGYQLSVDKFEETYQKTIAKGETVRGIVIINPSNPLGKVYSAEELEALLEWAAKYKLHVVADEVYGLTVYKEGAQFTSVCAVAKIPDPQRTHIIWGFSKDFGLSGFRTGVLISWNAEALKTISKVSYLTVVPPLVQHKLTCLVSDKKWLDEVLFPSNRTALQKSSDYCSEFLRGIGVSVLEPSAGLYVWADFSKHMKSVTEEEQRRLFDKLIKTKVLIDPSPAYNCTEYARFRIVFAFPHDLLLEGLRRIKVAIEEYQLMDQ